MKKIITLSLIVICSVFFVCCSQKWQENRERAHRPNPCYEYKLTGADPLIFPIQQGHAQLSIPQAVFDQAYSTIEVKKLNKCLPYRMRLEFDFNTKTKKLIDNDSTVTDEDKPFVKYNVLAVEIEDLNLTPQETKQTQYEYVKYLKLTDPKLYEDKLKMKHYPLWFYPNADVYRHGVIGTKNSVLNQPYLLSCAFDVTTSEGCRVQDFLPCSFDKPKIDPNDKEPHKEMINAKVINDFYVCSGLYHLDLDNTTLSLDLDLKEEAIPYVDIIYKQLDEKIKSYFSLSKQPNQSISSTK